MNDYVKKEIMREIEQSGEKGLLNQAEKIKIAGKFNVPVSYVETVSGSYSFDSGRDLFCTGLSCAMHRGGKEDEAVSRIGAKGVSCLGYCDHAPVVRIDGRFMKQKGSEYAEIQESLEEVAKKSREDIDTYVNSGGYSQLRKLLESGSGESVISALEKSGMRGMGGAGFPVAVKWRSFASSNNGNSYLMINAHEGEPGTFKDRKILEEHPHSVIEGALIAAVANNIPRVVIALKKEYDRARDSLEASLKEMDAMFQADHGSALPEIILESLAGSYVTGEETALMEAVEGNRSEPRLRPPFPTERGLYGKPTLVHNVETFSAIPAVLRQNDGGKPDKSFCLTGDVASPGDYSIQPGVTARDLVSKYGKTDAGKIKAFLPGGLSGGILPSSFLDTGLDFDPLKKAGAGFGTGAFIALSEDRCVVDAMKNISGFFADESCGKCVPCRLGTKEIREILSNVSEGIATESDLQWASEVARTMIDGSICALGQAAGKVFLDSIRHFRDEYNDHLNGKCPSGACKFGGEHIAH